jgi:hypothetical protein
VRLARTRTRSKNKKSTAPPRTHGASSAGGDGRELQRALALELSRLELASGYDGLFRGQPEPVVAVAAYAISSDAPPRTIMRGAFSVRLSGASFPGSVAVNLAPAWARARAVPSSGQVLLVGVGIEDDGGGGPGGVLGALERCGELMIATADNGHDVTSFAELAASPDAARAWATPRRALLMLDGAPLAARCAQDDWVGAAAVLFPTRPRTVEHRLHLASDDGKNDWTAVIVSRFAY